MIAIYSLMQSLVQLLSDFIRSSLKSVCVHPPPVLYDTYTYFRQVVLIPEEPEDMWHAYNLVTVGDSIKSTTIRYTHVHVPCIHKFKF